jgi:hypothetical protein
MKHLPALLALLLATPALAAPIFQVLPEGSTTAMARIYIPIGELDADGDPLETPVQSAAIRDRWSEELLACVAVTKGEEISFEFPLPAARRPKVWGRAYSNPDCTGMESDASLDWYVIFKEPPMRLELR